jgi:hypothetical protein
VFLLFFKRIHGNFTISNKESAGKRIRVPLGNAINLITKRTGADYYPGTASRVRQKLN